jgi:glycosyltransferase involved in cell wall biosynthesis
MYQSDTCHSNQSVPKIAVVIPCYKVARTIEKILEKIGPEVSRVYCVDDGCPENSGSKVRERSLYDNRIRLLQHDKNQGVGVAVMTGYKTAAEEDAEIIVKIDGDGQMNPADIPRFVNPILQGEADYVKGNRFYHLEGVRRMPWVRLVGNAGLSFLTKLSSGYWNLFDPTNGYTAIHSSIVRELPAEKIHPRFFFESDMLFHLNLLRAVIVEVPMEAVYADEKSSLNPWRAFFEFPALHFRNFLKRLFYNYWLRNFSVASLNLLLGVPLSLFGIIFGLVTWISNAYKGITTPSGTVMVSALPIILGVQLLVGFLSHDMADIPKVPIHRRLQLRTKRTEGKQ